MESLDKKHQELLKEQSGLYKGLQDIWRLQNLKKQEFERVEKEREAELQKIKQRKPGEEAKEEAKV